jgi:hypothetical protein
MGGKNFRFLPPADSSELYLNEAHFNIACIGIYAPYHLPLRQTHHVANMVPESLPFAISQDPINFRLFYKHSDPSFQWLQPECNEKLL